MGRLYPKKRFTRNVISPELMDTISGILGPLSTFARAKCLCYAPVVVVAGKPHHLKSEDDESGYNAFDIEPGFKTSQDLLA